MSDRKAASSASPASSDNLGVASIASADDSTPPTTNVSHAAGIPSNMIVPIPMPIPGTQNAPHFNGKFATDFLNRILLHGKAAGFMDTDRNMLVDYIYHYSSDLIKESIRYLPEFDIELPNKTWQAAVEQLISMFASTDMIAIVNEEDLIVYTRQSADKSSFTSQKDVESYYLGFQKLAAPLVKSGDITPKKRDLLFAKGIPKTLQDWFNNTIPEENRLKDNPPPIEQSRKILVNKYDHKTLFYESTDPDQKQSSYDGDGNRIEASKAKFYSVPPLPTSSLSRDRPEGSSVDVDALAKAMEELNLNQILIRQLLAAVGTQSTAKSSPAPPPNDSNRQPSPNRAFSSLNRGQRCLSCGGTEGVNLNHPLGMNNCSKTAELVADGLIIYNVDRRRYVLPDGRDLPFAPPGLGIADILRKPNVSVEPKRDVPPHMSQASTSNVKLKLGDLSIGKDGIFGVCPTVFDTGPALRSGRDTSNCYDPSKRPDGKTDKSDNKGKQREQKSPVQGPSTSKSPDSQQSPPKKDVRFDIPAPENPINRQDGWQDSLPSKKKPQDDVMMKDSDPKRPNQGYHFTSDIQEKTDIQQIMNECLHQVVPIKFGALVGASPKLQSAFMEAFRTKRVYNQPAESRSSNSIDFLSDFSSDSISSERLMVGNPEPREMERFVTNYAAKAVKTPSEKYMAMTCGFLKVEINGKMFKALVDTGSEINIGGTHVDEDTGSPLDFVGMRWSLKGIHGKPEQLKGLIVDCPLRIGNHDFPAHIFVSRFHMEQDIILGQPFFHWYATRFDFLRSGKVLLYLWETGDRDHDPTISIMVADLDNKRNISSVSQAAYIEEVNDEEDF